MKEYAFGIDLGGTTAKIGLFKTTGELLEKWEVPTDTSNAGEHILENLAAAVQGKLQEKGLAAAQVEGVGVGVPGPVLDSRIVPIICANLGGWGKHNVAEELSTMLGGIRVLVGNDANVAALGEIWMGAAKGCRSAVMVTLGTGVGGGVIVNGKVIDGTHGAGGGDAFAAREVDEMTDTLGMALATIAATVDPEMFMVGGGVSRAGEVLFAPLREHFKVYAFKSCRETPIVPAILGNDAGIYGSVRLIVGE